MALTSDEDAMIHVSYTIIIIPQFICFGITSSAESNFQCDYAWLIMKLYFDETSLQTMSIRSAEILLSEPSVKKCIVLACTLCTPYWPVATPVVGVFQP